MRETPILLISSSSWLPSSVKGQTTCITILIALRPPRYPVLFSCKQSTKFATDGPVFRNCSIIFFYDNCRNSLALIGYFLSSISGQTHEFTIYAMRQRAREDSLTVCYGKKQIDVSFSCVCPFIDNEFRHNNCQGSLRIHSVIASWMHNYNVMTKFMINNRTDA